MFLKILFRNLSSGIVCVILCAGLFVSPVQGAVLTVNTLTDEADGSCSDGDCSLRDAIATAASGSTIQFSVTGAIVLSSKLTINKSLTITGPGASRLTLDGNNTFQILDIGGLTENVSLSGLTFAHGNSGGFFGGAIKNGALLSVDQCVFTGNHSNGNGGALFSNAPVTITNSRFESNSAGSGGALSISSTTATLTNLQFSGNSATGNDGGAIYANQVTAVVNITRCMFTDNHAIRHGGAVFNSTGSSVNVTLSQFRDNSANPALPGNQGSGGAIYNQNNLSIEQSAFIHNSAGTVDTSNNTGGALYTTGTTNITNTTFYNNKARSAGGAISYQSNDDTLLNSTIYGNALLGVGSGAGVYSSQTTVTAINTIIADNRYANGNLGNCGTNFSATSTNNLSDGGCTGGFSTTTLPALALSWKGSYLYPAQGSVAIDAGTNNNCPTTDQRGWMRPVDGDDSGEAICDIGSIEATPNLYETYLPALIR